jgi:EAL domain-containing protein (putative c-di-GMP-specific phosphodiesterase class I)
VTASPLTAGPVPDLTPMREVAQVLAGTHRARCAYQPIVDLSTGEVRGYEALARFGPGLRSPTPFFEAADVLQQRSRLEAVLVAEALSARPSAPAGRYLSLNVTPALLTQGPVWSVLHDAGSLDGVVIELTEHLPMGNLPRLRRRLDALRERGARVALDDVGAGWSGLQQVAELRPDIVKIDRSLVHGLQHDEARQAVVELLCTLTDRLGGELVAEGIEVAEELHCVLQSGVRLGQGWFLGRPQFGWSSVPPAASQLLRTRAARDVDLSGLAHGARRLAEVASSPAPVTTRARAADRADHLRRLRQTWTRTARRATGGKAAPAPLTMSALTPLGDALRLAMARTKADRFDPVVCLRPDGDVLGIVHIEDLIATV